LSRCPSCADGCCPVCVPAAALIDERDRWIQDCHAAESAAEAMEAERDAMARRLGGALAENDRLLDELVRTSAQQLEYRREVERRDELLHGADVDLKEALARVALLKASEARADRAEEAARRDRERELYLRLNAAEERADRAESEVAAWEQASALHLSVTPNGCLLPDGVAVVREALEHCRQRPHEHNPLPDWQGPTRCEVIDRALAALPVTE